MEYGHDISKINWTINEIIFSQNNAKYSILPLFRNRNINIFDHCRRTPNFLTIDVHFGNFFRILQPNRKDCDHSPVRLKYFLNGEKLKKKKRLNQAVDILKKMGPKVAVLIVDNLVIAAYTIFG